MTHLSGGAGKGGARRERCDDRLLHAAAANPSDGRFHRSFLVPLAISQMGRQGQACVEANRGSLQRVLDLIEPLLQVPGR